MTLIETSGPSRRPSVFVALRASLRPLPNRHSLAGWLVPVLLLSILPDPGTAGPNSGGSLLLTHLDGVAYTGDERPDCDALDLTHCTQAVSRYDGVDTIVLKVFAAFPPETRPRLTGVGFGWQFEESKTSLVDWGACAGFEIPTEGWPAPGEGTAVSWGLTKPQTSNLIGVYWAAAYNYYGGPAVLELTRHPLGIGDFVDDSVPPQADGIVAFGSFGFSADGSLPCPPEPASGACCLQAECLPVPSEEACLDQGGTYLPGQDCEPDPCSVTPAVVESWGKVKEKFSR